MSGSRKVIRNLISTVSSQLLSWGITLTLMIVITRAFTASELGKFTFVGSYLALFGVFTSLGTSTVIVREIAVDRERAGELVRTGIALRLPLSIAVAAIAIAVAHFTGNPPVTMRMLYAGSIGMILSSVNDALASGLVGQENIVRQNITGLIEKFAGSSLAIFIVLSGLHYDLWWFYALSIFVGLLILAINISAFPGLMGGWRKIRFLSIRTLTYSAMPFFAMYVFRTMYNQVDATIIHYTLPKAIADANVGWYGTSNKLLGSALFIPVAMATVLLPSLSRMHAIDETQFMESVRRAMGLIIVAVVPIAVPIIILPGFILFTLLHYPVSQYQNSVPIFRIFGCGLILWYITQISGTALVVRKQEALMCKISIWALVLTLASCLVFTPLAYSLWKNGGIGSATSDVLVEVFMVCAFGWALPRGFFGRYTFVSAAKTALAAVPYVVLLSFVHGMTATIMSILGGTTVYLGLCVMMGCVSREDIHTFTQAIVTRKAA